MHPSRAIRGRLSPLLSGRRIVVGVSGSIAAIEVPRIVRELIRHGAEVEVVMSAEAARLLTPEAVEFATGHPPVLQLSGGVEHVTWFGPGEGRADLYLVAPATANTISKIAHGIDDTPVTSCASVALGGGVPILLAPAMHEQMARNPAVKENVGRLRRWGVGWIEPRAAEGEAKLAPPEEIAAAVLHRIAGGPWVGRSVVVIAGAAHEPIDDVRAVTNESSGATGVALARQAHFRGAEVSLWAGPLRVAAPEFLAIERWASVRDLLALVARRRAELRSASAIFVPAALSDFTLTATPGKIASRGRARLDLSLRRAPKVLPTLRGRAPPPTVLVAFKLEARHDDAALEASAKRLRSEVGADWVVANDARTMGSAEIRALVLPPEGRAHWIRGPKPEFAGRLLEEIGGTLPPVGSRREATASRPARRPRRRS